MHIYICINICICTESVCRYMVTCADYLLHSWRSTGAGFKATFLATTGSSLGLRKLSQIPKPRGSDSQCFAICFIFEGCFQTRVCRFAYWKRQTSGTVSFGSLIKNLNGKKESKHTWFFRWWPAQNHNPRVGEKNQLHHSYWKAVKVSWKLRSSLIERVART